jgi:DNA modification methylase
MFKPYYQDKWVTIYNGDSREILPQLDVKVDLVLTDPPYGINIVKVGGSKSFGRVGGSKSFGKAGGSKIVEPKDYLPVHGDDELFDPRPFMGYGKILMFFGANYFADKLPPSSCWLVWDKDNTGYFADCELIWTNLKTAVRRLIWRWNGLLQEDMKHKEYRYHPTQKPEAVISWCITQAGENINTILDPFLGSGTTCYCAKKLNRYSIGIEIEEKYCEIAAKRCSQEVMELNI